ncbi:MAG: GTP 3',8-cyclase MoaA, partial [Promethearchaeota archaeon]
TSNLECSTKARMVKNITLIDRFGRKISRFRISITSKCNLNCAYCHHEGYHDNSKHSQLTLDQIHQISKVVHEHGISSIKLTGGEPLLHPNVLEIIKEFSSIPSVKDVSLTTNGYLLKDLALDLKKAGLNRLNIGCDSLENDWVKSAKNIEEGLKAIQDAGFTATKLNMVLLKNVNDHEFEAMLDLSRKNGLILQVIELINTNDEFFRKYHASLDDIEKELERRARRIVMRNANHRKQYVIDEKTIVELVKPVHNSEFCLHCRTLRITNDFQFQPCLNRTDNLVPIEDDIEKALKIALDRREPFYVS